jgi:hypothetical protein
MKVGPFDVGLEGWGDNANMVTRVNLQRKVHEIT